MTNKNLQALSDAGVAIWLDDLSRTRLRSGSLAQLLIDKNVVGVTTNPTIFQKAIVGSEVYTEQLTELAHKLKGAARAAGATALGNLAATLEKSGQVADVEALEIEWRRVAQALAPQA